MTALAILGQSLSASEAQERYFKKEIVPLLDKYCYRCHDADVQKGDFRLDVYKNAAQLLPNRQHWLKVLGNRKRKKCRRKSHCQVKYRGSFTGLTQ